MVRCRADFEEPYPASDLRGIASAYTSLPKEMLREAVHGGSPSAFLHISVSRELDNHQRNIPKYYGIEEGITSFLRNLQMAPRGDAFTVCGANAGRGAFNTMSRCI